MAAVAFIAHVIAVDDTVTLATLRDALPTATATYKPLSFTSCT